MQAVIVRRSNLVYVKKEKEMTGRQQGPDIQMWSKKESRIYRMTKGKNPEGKMKMNRNRLN